MNVPHLLRRRNPPPITMAAAAEAGNDDHCSADSLHGPWLRAQRIIRNELVLARRDGDPAALRASLDRALARHKSYHSSRARFARADPVLTFADLSSTPLERAAHWLAGWRPTTFIHLLYSESSLLFESQLSKALKGARSGGLSSAQMVAVDALHRRTVVGERDLARELEDAQHAVVQRFPPSDSDMQLQTERLGEVIARAEELRMRTLEELVALLETAQAVDLLVALAELELGIRRVGTSPRGASRRQE